MKEELILKYAHAPIPNIAAIHDLASWGRCSLSVVIPVLSVMGYQVTPLPTALLSTHTGGFQHFTFLDLSEEMKRVAEHWERIAIPFRGIYSGFLGSEKQIDTVSAFIDVFKKEDTVVLVDPVLGDDGEYYATCHDGLCRGMRALCAKADIICPNVTEACLLAGRSAKVAPGTHEEFVSLLSSLHDLGTKNIVITGYESKDCPGEIGAICSDGENVFVFTERKCEKSYPGTGELFASVMFGKMLSGMSLQKAVKETVSYVRQVIAYSSACDYPTREGVLLETHLSTLIPEENQPNQKGE